MAALLALTQAVMGEMGLPVPTSVVSNTQNDVMTVLSLLNASGNELRTKFPWQALDIEYRFYSQFSSLDGTLTSGSAVVTGLSSTAGLDSTYMVTGTGINQDTSILSVDSSTQVTLSQNSTASGVQALTFSKTQYALPSDFDYMVDRTQWDKSKHWEMLGPEDSQQWQWLKSGYISTGPRIRFRLLGGKFQVWPPLSTAEYLGYEYQSKNWAKSSTGTTQESFLADTDTCVYRDRLIICFAKLKYFQLKSFDTTAFQQDYETQLELATGQEKSSPILSMAPSQPAVLLGYNNIPDSGYGT